MLTAQTNQSIQKTYHLHKVVVTEVSPGKGAVEYYLSDDQGTERKVTAIAKLGWNHRVNSVKAVFHRETPLVDALSRATEGDAVEVDFAPFNEQFPRPELNDSPVSHPAARKLPRKSGNSESAAMYREIYADMTYQARLKNWLPDLSGIGMLVLFLFALWMVYMTYNELVSLFVE